ncbi:hypothetical protein HBI59_021620 [Parastagonospora nodorum]|nr:hypothetical protein HBI59_021620 [Parastagonospora nodorum]
MVKNTRNQQVRGGVALPPVKRARPLSQIQESVKKLRTMQSATLPSLSRETILQSNLQDSATSTWSQTHKPRRYAGSNKGTPAPSRTSQSIETRHQAGMKTISQHKLKQNTAATRHTSQTQKNALRSVQSFLPLSHLADPFHQITLNKAQSEAQKTAPLPVRSSIATTPCRSAARQMLDICSDLRTHVIRQARIEVTAAYALNHLELQVLKPSELLQDFVYLRQDPRNPASPRFLNSAIAAIIARAANIIALIGTVLYNAIKEYHDDRTRKTIYFHSYTIENNYNAIREKWKRLSEIRRLLIWDALKQQIAIHANHIKNSRSNVTVPDDHHNNNVDDILMKYTDNERQRYNTLIEDYNRAGKREDNILTIDECRTGHSNEEDIEADEREEETRVRLRESSEEIHDILLREFRGANDFTESITHNDDEQVWFQNKEKEKYTIDNRIVHALALTKDEWELEPEDCDALVERYEEEINCSDLYSTV